MSQATIIGVKPWLPTALPFRQWWAEPVRAERLASLRIATAAVLLVDIVVSYLPYAAVFLGPGSLGSPEVFAAESPIMPASLLRWMSKPGWVQIALIAWTILAAMLFVGIFTRFSAFGAWFFSQGFVLLNPYIHNAGDTVRTIVLLYLMVSPSGAVWSLDAWRRQFHANKQITCVYAWPLRLLFIQMAVIYFFNGLNKLAGPLWRSGESMHYVLTDLTTARISYAEMPIPFSATAMLTWFVLVWELGFPILVMMRPLRTITLVIGVLLHLGIGLTMELGTFPLIMLCLYVPLIPWERWVAAASSCLPAKEP